jgi:5-(carboxyamino)imidazole ribonucleotide mutase
MKEVLMIVGSKSDLEFASIGEGLMEELGIAYETKIFSAHRNLKELLSYLDEKESDFKVIITIAGLSAALSGIVASQTKLPVIGVPREVGVFKGVDAAISMMQTPSPVPVATMGIGKQGIKNAIYLAKRILDISNREGK